MVPSLWGQGAEGYGLNMMCLGVKLTRGALEIVNIDDQLDWIGNHREMNF